VPVRRHSTRSAPFRCFFIDWQVLHFLRRGPLRRRVHGQGWVVWTGWAEMMVWSGS
jgi:hypothetical protein